MKLKTRALALIAIAPSLAATGTLAEEVHLNQVADTVNTEKTARLHGAYFGAFGSAAKFADADFEKNLMKYDFEANEDDGWFAGIEFGYSFRTPLPVRVGAEVEFGYLSSSVLAEGSRDSAFRSNVRAAVATVNGIVALDLDDYAPELGPFWTSFRPYFGGGVGIAYAGQRNANLTKFNGRERPVSEETDVTFAYQMFAGLEVAMTETFSFYGEYKHLVLSELRDGAIAGAGFDLWTLGVKVQY